MGACQSRKSQGDVIVSSKSKSASLKAAAAPPPRNDGQASSVGTCITHQESDYADPGNRQAPARQSSPIVEESIVSIDSTTVRPDSDVSLHSLTPEASPKNHETRHTRSTTCDMLLEYLQGEGSSENRAMVHIENPGVSIEDVYDGVHDGDILGVGITGNVRKIVHKDTGIERALKRLDLSNLKNKEDLNKLLDEVKIMCSLDHPNIVCLEEVYEGDSELYLTQELCTGNDLFDRLEEQTNESYTEEQCAKLVRQIISSVSYLHSKNIIHRDLKLENFLFQDKSANSQLKMIDFGLSKHFHTGEMQHEMVGTPYTVAPEVLTSKDGYDAKVDVWAIGVITYLLLSGDTPFGGACEGDNLMDVRNRILSGHVSFGEGVWSRVSDLAIDFIKSILVLDPNRRPSVEELPKHPWLITMKRNSSISDDEVPLDPKVVSGLVSFKEMSNTTKFLCEVLSFTLQPEQIACLRSEFEKLDSAGIGEINLDGFKTALLERSDEFPLTDVEIEEIFNGLHVRKRDISIRWHEFIAACLNQCQIDERNIRLAFDRLDSEHKGYVTLDDLKNIMDFYGTDRGDLQQIWINDVLDYKSKKEHMTYDDFYKLLKLDRKFSNSTSDPTLSKLAPLHGNDVMVTKSECHITRRLSALDIMKAESPVVSSVKTYRNLQSVILDASRYAEKRERAHSRRRTSLVLRRSSNFEEVQVSEVPLFCKSADEFLE